MYFLERLIWALVGIGIGYSCFKVDELVPHVGICVGSVVLGALAQIICALINYGLPGLSEDDEETTAAKVV